MSCFSSVVFIYSQFQFWVVTPILYLVTVEGNRWKTKWDTKLLCLTALKSHKGRLRSLVSVLQDPASWVNIHHLEYTDGGILDPDDVLADVVEDKDKVELV